MVENIMHGHNCLFGLSDYPFCGYDPTHPIVYLSLGSAISALAIIFAAIQMGTPSWKIILKIRPFWQRNLIWFMTFIGLLFVIFASIVPQFNGLIAPFNYPIVYELIATIFFLSSPLVYLYLAKPRRGIFKKNPENFFQVILNEASRADNDQIGAIVNVIGANLDDISKAARKSEIMSRQDLNNLSVHSEEVNANGVLNIILSEHKIVNYIAEGRFDFLIHYLNCIKDNELTSRTAGTGFCKIVKTLLVNKNSILYRQLDMDGLSLLQNNLFNSIFFNNYIIYHFNPLNEWDAWFVFEDNKRFDQEYLDVYLKAVKIAWEAYWFDESYTGSPRDLYVAFNKLEHYVSSLLSNRNGGSVNHELIFARFSAISNFLKYDCIHIYKKVLNDDKEKMVAIAHDDLLMPESSIGYCVGYIFKFLSALSNYSNSSNSESVEDSVRMLSMDLVMKISEDPNLVNVKEYLFKLIWSKIHDNVRNGFYPPILRIYISLFCFKPSSTYKDAERDELVKFMYQEFKPKLVAGSLMADRKSVMRDVLLPKFVIFNDSTGKFEWIQPGGSNQIIE